MFHVPKENMYSPIGCFFFTWPRTRACSNLLYLYVCVCIWPINSWERDIKIAHTMAELSIPPCKSANFSIHSEVQFLCTYICILQIHYQKYLIFTIVFFYHHTETVHLTKLPWPHASLWSWRSCASSAGSNCPVYLRHRHGQTLSQIMSSEAFEWILSCIV